MSGAFGTHLSDFTGLVIVPRLFCERPADLLAREADFLRLFDEADAPDRL